MKLPALVIAASCFLYGMSCLAGPRITSLTADGVLSATCGDTNTHWAVQWSTHMDRPWMPSAFFNMSVTTTTSSVTLPLDHLGSCAFFRVISAPEEMLPPPGAGYDIGNTNGWGSVTGMVSFWQGDFLPGEPTGTVTPVQRTLCFFEKTKNVVRVPGEFTFFTFVVSPFFASTASSTNGDFSIALPPGNYSLLAIERTGEFYANRFDGGNYVWPVRVESNRCTAVQFNINYLATD